MMTHELKTKKASLITSTQNTGKNALSFPARSVVQRQIADSVNSTPVFRQENEDVQQVQPGGINVNYPPAPANDHVQTWSGISSNHSNSWTPFIENNRLTFGFEYNGSGAVTMAVVLTDDWGNGYLSQGAVHWDAGSGGERQYIEFSGFPTRPDGSEMDSCSCEATMRNDSSDSGVQGWEYIYQG